MSKIESEEQIPRRDALELMFGATAYCIGAYLLHDGLRPRRVEPAEEDCIRIDGDEQCLNVFEKQRIIYDSIRGGIYPNVEYRTAEWFRLIQRLKIIIGIGNAAVGAKDIANNI